MHFTILRTPQKDGAPPFRRLDAPREGAPGARRDSLQLGRLVELMEVAPDRAGCHAHRPREVGEHEPFGVVLQHALHVHQTIVLREAARRSASTRRLGSERRSHSTRQGKDRARIWALYRFLY